ncbi:30S ribosomal protein S19 [bacterium]|nr:30S ribosomal protein S19 [bacterium]
MSKKDPYIQPSLVKKILREKKASTGKAIRTWSRRSVIHPEMVGMVFEVHNGRRFDTIRISEAMVGHRLGEFAPTRRFTGHRKKKDVE